MKNLNKNLQTLIRFFIDLILRLCSVLKSNFPNKVNEW